VEEDPARCLRCTNSSPGIRFLSPKVVTHLFDDDRVALGCCGGDWCDWDLFDVVGGVLTFWYGSTRRIGIDKRESLPRSNAERECRISSSQFRYDEGAEGFPQVLLEGFRCAHPLDHFFLKRFVGLISERKTPTSKWRSDNGVIGNPFKGYHCKLAFGVSLSASAEDRAPENEIGKVSPFQLLHRFLLLSFRWRSIATAGCLRFFDNQRRTRNFVAQTAPSHEASATVRGQRIQPQQHAFLPGSWDS